MKLETPSKLTRRTLIVATGLLSATIIAGASHGTTWPGGSAPDDPPPMTLTKKAGISSGVRVDQTKVLTGSDGSVRMELMMKADASKGEVATAPTDLVVVFDRSSSMEGTKIEEAKAALREIISQLGESDRFALVSYSTDASTDIPMQSVTASSRASFARTVDGLYAGGYTNIGDAIDRATSVVESHRSGGRQSRVILISDGNPTAGDTSEPGLVARARHVSRREFVMSTVGVGDDFNEKLMSGMADAGTGNYYYLTGDQKLAEIFKDEFDSARETVATGLAVRIPTTGGVRVVDAAGYPLEHEGSTAIFRPGTLFAGQERRVWVTLSVPTGSDADIELLGPALTFTDGTGSRTLESGGLPMIACVTDKDTYLAGLDKKVWERSVVEGEYNELQAKVADMVSRGDAAPARALIENYRSRNEELNRVVKSQAVIDNFGQLDQLEQDLDDAFTGPNQGYKQNKLGKKRSAAAWDGRRIGSKR